MDVGHIASTVLRSAAPTLLTALAIPPPFGLIASAGVSYLLKTFLPPGQEPAAVDPRDGKTPILSPEQIVKVTEANAANVEFLRAMQKAEIDLKRLELELPWRFEELAEQSRTRASRMAVDTGTADKVFDLGRDTLRADKWMTYGILFGGAALMGATAYWKVAIDPILSNAIFTMLGLIYGKHSARADQVTGFYFGSSQGSKEKTDAINVAFGKVSEAFGRAPPAASPGTIQLPSEPVRQGGSIEVSATPLPDSQRRASSGQETRQSADVSDRVLVDHLAQDLKALVAPLAKPHNYRDSATWKLGIGGVAYTDRNGNWLPLARTDGKPVTVQSIWRDHGAAIRSASLTNGVPVELIVATIATESRNNPRAYRREPDGRESAGLMQTLTGTAGEMLGRQVSVHELYAPETSINAGAMYIAHQAGKTGMDPPKVAAAYNAGGVYHEDHPDNRWRMRCYPAGTGAHIDRFIMYFNDSMTVSAEEGWGADGTMSFVSALRQ